MENIIKSINEIQLQMQYFRPTESWEPQKYNVFLDRLENIIKQSSSIILELKSIKVMQSQKLIKQVEGLLQSYNDLKEKYY